MKLCVFVNDPILAYYKKGEIKKGYFNPMDFFKEIHVISLFDQDIDASIVQELAGSGTLFIHKLGKANLSNYKSFNNKIKSCIQKIKPDIIRTYNGLVIGWLAVKVAKSLNIPVVVSLHTNQDQQRAQTRKKKFFQFLKLKYISIIIEKFVITNADAIICVYKSILPYVEKFGVKNAHVIYNGIDTNCFSPESTPKFKSTKPIILSVGGLIDQRDYKLIVNAVKDLDVKLLLIGDGPNYEEITSLVKLLKISDKVEMIKSVPNKELNAYYASARIFAQPLVNLDGVGKPTLEAMASGLPVVMSRQKDYSEIIDEAVVYVENDPNNFKAAFEEILADRNHEESLRKKSLNVANQINDKKMEQKTRDLYANLLK